jgi:fructose-bisphosphate aldolase, class I
MGYVGRQLRERRIFFPHTNRALIVPVDHGLTLGPIPGMQETQDFARWIGSSHISAVVGHKGLVERLVTRDMLHPSTGVIVHVNGMPNITRNADDKVMVASIESALRLGADAVSLQTNFTEDNFAHNLAMLGTVTDAAHRAGLPVLTMLYDKVRSGTPALRVGRLNHLIRIVAELGCDAVKLAMPQGLDEMRAMLEHNHRDIRVLFAGGERGADDALAAAASEAVRFGACGLCVGRSVFQHPQPQELLRRLAACVKGESEVVGELAEA